MNITPIYNNYEDAPMGFYKFTSIAIWISVVCSAIMLIFSLGSIIYLVTYGCLFALSLVAAVGLRRMIWKGVQAYYASLIFSLIISILNVFWNSYYDSTNKEIIITSVIGCILNIAFFYLCYVYFGKRRNLFYPSDNFSYKVNEISLFRKKYSVKAKDGLHQYIDHNVIDIIIDAAFDRILDIALNETRFPADDEVKEMNMYCSNEYRENRFEEWTKINSDMRKFADGSEVQIDNVVIGNDTSENSNPVSRILAVAGTYSLLMSSKKDPDFYLEEDDSDRYYSLLDEVLNTFYNREKGIMEGQYSNSTDAMRGTDVPTEKHTVDSTISKSEREKIKHIEDSEGMSFPGSTIKEVSTNPSDDYNNKVHSTQNKNDETAIVSDIYDEQSLDSDEGKMEIESDENPQDTKTVFDDIKFCFKCGHDIKPDAVFCEKCGARIR